jgi:uncharacterized membrane protein YdfJ with MMPL/SSD domain
MPSPFVRIAEYLYDNRRTALIVWAIATLLIVGALTSQVQRLVKVGGYSLPGTEFHLSSEILKQKLGIAADKTAVVVYDSGRYRVYDKVFHDAVIASLDRLLAHPLVDRYETFYETGVPDFVSPDNRTLFAILHLTGSEEAIEYATPELREAARSDVLEVAVTGILAGNYDIEQATAQDLAAVEVFTIPAVLIILMVFLRSILLGFIPLLVGVVSILLTLGLVAAIALGSDVSIFAINISTMIGLGLAIDFSLIAMDRFRSELAQRPHREALCRTLDTAGRSILLSGMTLFMTMIVWALFPVMIIRSIAFAISLSAFIAVFTALFLMPVVLAYLGPRLERKYRRRPPAASHEGNLWGRLAYRVMRSPWASLILALGILLALASPLLDMERRGVNLEVLPEDVESRHAGDILAEKFGRGYLAPIMIVIETANGGVWDQEVMEGLYRLHTTIERQPQVQGVRSLISMIPNHSLDWAVSLSQRTVTINKDYYRLAKRFVDVDADNSATVLYVFPDENEVHPSTVALLEHLRANVRDWAPTLAGVNLYVGGAPAMQYDFIEVVDDEIPLFFALTLFANFLTLVVIFKSILIPIKAVLTNLLTLAASFGILVLVFQHGVGADLFGAEVFGSITFYTPVVGFAILYGLSTDYEVFLISRVREKYAAGLSHDDSVAVGVQESARVITAAGIIMVIVFGSFAATQVLVTKELGLVLAIAILIDMTLVRLVLVPASMKLMGRLNWWIPVPLDRLLPDIRES